MKWAKKIPLYGYCMKLQDGVVQFGAKKIEGKNIGADGGGENLGPSSGGGSERLANFSVTD
jgi:hypothetical protein